MSIDVYEQGIIISDDQGEIVSWVDDEWIKEPEIIPSILYAMKLYYEQGPETLRSIIGR